MKKKRILLTVAILSLCMAFIMTACSNSDDGGKGSTSVTVSKATTSLEAGGWDVSSSTVGGISALIATKNTDSLTILFCSSESTAKSSLSIYETAASMQGQTCKRDKANIYYGTTAGINAYEAI